MNLSKDLVLCLSLIVILISHLAFINAFGSFFLSFHSHSTALSSSHSKTSNRIEYGDKRLQMRYKIQPTYSQHVRNPLCVVFIARCLAIRNMNTMGSLSTKPGRNAFEISLYAEVNVYCSIFH